MRNKILLGVVFVLIIVLGIVIYHEKKTNYYFPMPSAVKDEENAISIRLLDESTGKILNVNLEDYIIGVVSAEMPASFEVEALKAQAVAARTFAMYKKNTRNLDYDLIIGVKDQAYKTNEQLLKTWNVLFFNNYLKIRDAVLSTKDEVLTYNDEIINAFYFSMSNGKTENSELVFSEALPYLQSVESSWDNESLNNYLYEKVISKEDFCNSLGISCESVIISDEVRSSSNRVLSLKINDIVFKGTDIRTKLGLRSTDFVIREDGSNYLITTKGYGHGVGMSQYGANGMAKEGHSYLEILSHYYQNTKISHIS